MSAVLEAKSILSLDDLRSVILPLIEEYGMRWARIFGSYARGEAEEYSDIDVLLDKGDARAISVGAVAEGIYEATGKRADVYDISELLPGSFRDAVLHEAVAL